jgi:hypothetical protein
MHIHASVIAILIAVGVFGLLNLIDMHRLD